MGEFVCFSEFEKIIREKSIPASSNVKSRKDEICNQSTSHQLQGDGKQFPYKSITVIKFTIPFIYLAVKNQSRCNFLPFLMLFDSIQRSLLYNRGTWLRTVSLVSFPLFPISLLIGCHLVSIEVVFGLQCADTPILIPGKIRKWIMSLMTGAP